MNETQIKTSEEPPKNESQATSNKNITLQVSCNAKQKYAERNKSTLLKEFKENLSIQNEGEFYKVQIMGFNSIEDATTLIPKLEKMGFKGTFVVTEKKQ